MIFYAKQICFLAVLLPAFAFAQTAVPQNIPATDSVTNRPTLLVFAGSDWCQPCIRFEKNVLNDSTFLAYASGRLSVQKAEFLQRKKLPAAQREANEQLAERYNPEGLFPHIVLLRPDGSVLAVLPSDAENGEAFVAQLHAYLPQ